MSEERDRSQHQPIPAPLRFVKAKCPACVSGDHGNPKFICPCECHTATLAVELEQYGVLPPANPTIFGRPVIPHPESLPPEPVVRFARDLNNPLPDGSSALVIDRGRFGLTHIPPVLSLLPPPPPDSTTRIAQIQAEILAWTNHNFGGPSVPIRYQVAPFLGMVEEIGEMAHHMLKDANKIRGTSEQHRAEVKDGLGDLFVFMCGFAAANEINLSDVIETTWEKVSKRDWKKFPENGMTK